MWVGTFQVEGGRSKGTMISARIPIPDGHMFKKAFPTCPSVQLRFGGTFGRSNLWKPLRTDGFRYVNPAAADGLKRFN